MVEVIFNYEGMITNIQCQKNDKMKDIIEKFLFKIKKKGNNLYYLYNVNKINKELTFHEQANEFDKTRFKMNIIVVNNSKDISGVKEIISKDIICPKCKENLFIEIKNFKINLYGCKNNHEINDIILNKYEETQKIDLSNIICDICKKNNKRNSHNNEFYICNTCDKNICPLCKSIHDENHKLIDYDDKNYICKNHYEPFNKYCKKCNKDICIICENEHIEHDIYDFRNLLFDKKDLLKLMEDLKKSIDKFKFKINIIKEIFDKTISIMDIYFKININFINNYNINKRCNHKLQNLKNLKDNNEKLINDIHKMLNNDKISEIYKFAFNNFYNDKGEKYIGEMKNGFKDRMGILFYDKDDIYEKKNMKMILKMIKKKEEENIIGIIIMIDMKVIIKMIKWKEKVSCTLIMEIDMKVILKMI